MIDHVEQRLHIKPRRLIVDTAYGTASMVGWLVKHKGIKPHAPVRDKSERNDGTFTTSAFVWDEQANEYRCPE